MINSNNESSNYYGNVYNDVSNSNSNNNNVIVPIRANSRHMLRELLRVLS